MTKRKFQPLALTAAAGLVVAMGHGLLRGDSPPVAKPAEATKSTETTKESKSAPIAFTKEVVATRTAVTPKPITDSIKNGLKYLVKNQQNDGGWNQGGGWRTANQGRVEGGNVEDPSDVGNTSVALLALIRAGNTPTEGEYKDSVKRGLRFLFERVEKAKTDDMYVTDVRNTQLQSKVGPYIDTFMANLVLAEMKGKAGEDDKRLIACLEKTMNKVVKNQTADGQFAGNGGWAPVLSVAMANKGVARAQQNGVQVDRQYFARAAEQSKLAVAGTAPSSETGGRVLGVAAPRTATRETVALGRSVSPAVDGSGSAVTKSGVAGMAFSSPTAGDAGVSLYRIAQGATNSQDVVNSLKIDADKALQTLKDNKASKEQRDEAQKRVDAFRKADEDNGKVQAALAENTKSERFIAGFGSNGGEEFLSFLNISETLVIKGGKEWSDWDDKMRKGMEKAQDKDGSWAGHHCITGKTFCTAGAVLVMLADRTPFPVDMLEKKNESKQPMPTPGTEKK